jgi:hypothetical protein
MSEDKREIGRLIHTARITILILIIAEIAMIIMVLITPIRRYSGGVEGYYSYTSYKIIFLEEEVGSGVLDAINVIVTTSSVVNIIAQIIVFIMILLQREFVYGGLSLGILLISVTYCGSLYGSLNIVFRELSRIPQVYNISTTAGIVTFPGYKVYEGPIMFLIGILLFIIVVKVAVYIVGYIYLKRVVEKEGLNNI